MRRGTRSSFAKGVVAFLLITVVAMIGAASHQRAAASSPAVSSYAALTAIGDFEAAVYHGPDTGLSLKGVLKLRATSAGLLTGQLVPKRGRALPVSGQLNGNAINLVFYLGGGKHIFGVGTFGQDPGAKKAFVGGPLVGPNRGDSGDWGIAAYLACRALGGNTIQCTPLLGL